MIYQWIEQLAPLYPVALLCRALSISKSAYYAFKQGQTYHQKENNAMIVSVFNEHKRRYGTRRLRAELQEKGISAGRYRIRKTLKANGLQAIQPKSFVPRTTRSGHGKRNSANLLLDAEGNRLFLATAPNLVWVSDITYLPMSDGSFSYLATWLDLFSRHIVGWQVEKHMEEDLVIKALEKALWKRQPAPGLILHSDRGGQYVGERFRKLIKAYRQSMSRKSDSYDNAFAESLFSRFKGELLQGGSFLNLEDARTEIFEYIEMYYNPIRRHSALGNKSPLQFEKNFYLNLSKPKN